MSLRCQRSLVVALVMGLVSGVVSAQEQLRHKFEAGSKTAYTMEQKQKMKMALGGQDMAMDIVMSMDISQVVDSVDGSGKAKVKQKVERMVMTMEGGPLGKMEFDSKSDAAPDGPLGMMAGPLKAMTTGETTMSISPLGEISDVKLPEKFQEEMKKLAENSGGFGGGSMFSEDQLKQMMNQGMMVLPTQPASPGTTWDNKLDIKTPMGVMKTVNKYTYAGKTKVNGVDLEKIDQTVEMKLEPAENAQFQMTMKTKDAKGTVLFDNNKGRIHEMTTKVVMEMEMGGLGQITTDQTTTFKLKP